MILTVYDEKQHNRTLREEGRREGHEKAVRKINALNNCLLEDGRMDDLKRSLKDNAFQEILLKEYGLDWDDADDLFL